MRLLRKLGSGLTALALCFLLTGFFGGGEKPQDCITAMIKAIDNNDSKSFAERVPLEFWISMVSIMNDEFQNSMKTAMSFIDGPAGANNFTSALSSAITPSVKRMAETAQETIRKQIDAGRTGMEKNSPWTSDTLGKVTASEAGTGAEADTATAVMELDGMKLTLGLAKINDKWILLGVGGNRKSALDTTLVLKKQKEQRAAELAQRRKGNALWLKEFGPIYEKAAKLDDAERDKLLNSVFNIDELILPGDKRFSTMPEGVTLQSEALWNTVAANILAAKRLLSKSSKVRNWKPEMSERFKYDCTEAIMLSRDSLILKFVETSGDYFDMEAAKKTYDQWLSGTLDETESITWYRYYIKKDGVWKEICYTGGNKRKKINHYAYLGNSTREPFSHTEYLTEFAKRYPELEKEASRILASEQVWKDSLQKTMKTTGEAIAVKNSKGLATLVDVPRLLRNRDSVETTAKWRLTQTENDTDVKAFAQEIDKGELSAENPLNGLDFATATVESITETQGVVVAGKQFLLFERAKVADPWKLVRVAKNENALFLPEDWEKEVEAKIVSLRAEAEQKRLADEAEAKRLAEEAEQKRLADEAEAKRLAEKLAKVQTETTTLFNAYADALEKKDPDAALSVLARVLAWFPDGQIDMEKSACVAPDAAYIRDLKQAIADGKPLEGVDATFFDPQILRKATVEKLHSDQASQNFSVAVLTAKDGSQRSVGLLEASSGKWLIATTPQSGNDLAQELDVLSENIPSRAEGTMLFQVESPAAAFAALLATKQGKAALAYLDIPSLHYWEGSSWSNPDEFIGAVIFPESLEGVAKSIADSIDKDGSFTIRNYQIDAKTIESAVFADMKGGIAVEFTDTQGKPGMLRMVPEGDTHKIFALTKNKNTYSSDYSLGNYQESKKKIAGKQEGVVKVNASRSVVAGLLDKITLRNVEIALVQVKDGSQLQMQGSAVATNTHDKPVYVEHIGMRIVDKEDRGFRYYYYSLTDGSVLLQPNKAVKISWQYDIDSTYAYLLQEVRDGRLNMQVFPYSTVVNKERYKRDTENLKVTKQADGLWSAPGFPPAKVVRKVYPEISRTENEALETTVKEREAQNTTKSIELINPLLKRLQCTFDPNVDKNGAIKITNPLPHECSVSDIQVDLVKDGVTEKSFTFGIRDKIKPGEVLTVLWSDEALKTAAAAGFKLEIAVTRCTLNGMDLRVNSSVLTSGVVPPLLYQADPILFTLTMKQAAGKAETPKADTPKTEAPKTEAPKAEAPKAEAPKVETPVAPTTVTDTPTPPEGKNSGKAVLGSTTLDLVGSAFGPDGKPDSAIRVSVQNPSPLVAVRIDNLGGTMASWKTSGVKTSAKGVIAVVRDGKPLNAANAAFSLDVTSPVVLDLLVQDTGVIAEGKTRLRVVFHHQDGKRSYSILEAAKK